MASEQYSTIILTVIAAEVGAKIDDEQRAWLRSKYKAIGLYKEGIWQFGKLLDNYVSGKPYELEEPDRTEQNAANAKLNRSVIPPLRTIY
jgi:hypothetical protein